jgi:hypothetical protein
VLPTSGKFFLPILPKSSAAEEKNSAPTSPLFNAIPAEFLFFPSVHYGGCLFFNISLHPNEGSIVTIAQ